MLTTTLKAALAALGLSTALAGTSTAAILTWDTAPGTVGVGNGTITGGVGTWDITNGNWTTDAGANNVAWVNANNDTAVFGGTAGAVTLGSNVTVGGLTFNTNAYSVAPGAGPFTIAFGVPGNINVSTGTTTITAAITGSNKITKTGNGTLLLNAANTFNGDIDLAAGRLQIQNGANEGSMLGASGNTLTFTGNAELYNADGAVTLGQKVTINGGVTGTFGGAFGEQTQINGVVAGSGTLVVQGYSAGFNVQLLNTANTFTGAIRIQSGDGATLGVRSLVDSATTIGLDSDSTGGIFQLLSGATGPMVFNQRQFELITNGNSGTNLDRVATIRNDSALANTLTINTDLLISGTGNKNLVLRGGNAGNNAFNGDIIDAIGTSKLTLYKRDGGKWILGGQNTYEGDTILELGTLELADNAQLRFIIGLAGINNKINDNDDAGAETLILNGDFVFDLTSASITLADSWNIVDVAAITETYGSTFSVKSTLGSFVENADIWTIAENGVGYEFSEATGILRVIESPAIPEPSSVLMGLAGLALIAARRRA